MFFKKVSSAIIGAGFLAAMAATPAMAADVSISGEIDMHLWQYSSTSSAPDAIEVDTAGSGDSYSHMYTAYDEAELKFKTKGKAANGWKVGTEIEIELGQGGKNDFELEEGSAYVDFGSVKLTAGWLEDSGAEYGTAAELIEAWDPNVKDGNEGPGFRVAIGGIENLDLDFKLRFQQAEDRDAGTENVSRNETQIRANYDFGMGAVRIIWASLSDKAIDSDSAGDYAYTEGVTDVYLALEFGQLAPFFEMTNISKDKTTIAGAESEEKYAQMILGTDFAMSKEMTLTAAYMTQSLDDGGDEKAEKTDMSVGARYKVKPVEFMAAYFSSSNNYSTYSGSGDDAKFSGLKFAMKVKF